MFARNKEEEKKKKIINLLLFKYMIDYCSFCLPSFREYVDTWFEDIEGISIDDVMEEFIKLSESIIGDNFV